MKSSRSTLLFVVACLVVGAVPARSQTLLYFKSQPGDYIGGGQEFTLTPSDNTITVERTSFEVHVIARGARAWDLHFAPPQAGVLTPAVYERTNPDPASSGLSVTVDERACATVTGRFTVLEAEYGPSAEVLRLAVDYEQHCDWAADALFGSVRINSSVPLGPHLSVSDTRSSEGDGGTVSERLRFVVSLSAPAATPVTVDYATSDETAMAGSDYDATSGTATFAAGVTSVDVIVPVRGDGAIEGNETLTLSLSNAVGAPVAWGMGRGSIWNDDPYEALIRLDSQPGDYVGDGQTFTLTPANGTITMEGGDRVHVGFRGATNWDLFFVRSSNEGVYAAAGGTLFVDGNGRHCLSTTGRYTVLQVRDIGLPGGPYSVVSFAADFEQHCEGAAAALFGSVRINSSVPLGPYLSVTSGRVYEGNAGTTSLRCEVSLSGPAATPVTVDYTTMDEMATAGSDYEATTGTATFPVGATSTVVDVPVKGDLAIERDESFALALSRATGAPIAFGLARGAILNDDLHDALVRFDSQPGDPVGGGRAFSLTPADATIVARRTNGGVHVVASGTAVWDLYFAPPSGADLTRGTYVGATRWPYQTATTPGLLVVEAPAGQPPLCATVTGRFTVLEAEYGPGDEVVRLALDYEQHCDGASPALFGSVRINSPTSLGVRVFVSGGSVIEGDTGVRNLDFPVWLSKPSTAAVFVSFMTADGTARRGEDYVSSSGSFRIPPGATDATIPVAVLGEVRSEADESLRVVLTRAVDALVGPPDYGLGLIVNDDPLPGLSVDDVEVVEGDPQSPAQAVFTLSLDRTSEQTVSVGYSTESGTAVADDDFQESWGTATFAPGTTSYTVSVPIVPDVIKEGDETFSLVLASPAKATLARGRGTATVLDDDGALGFYTLPPCRLLDSRTTGGPLEANTAWSFGVVGLCGLPSTVKAVAMNLTAVAPTDVGDLRLYPSGTTVPTASTLNFERNQTRASNAIVAMGPWQSIEVRCDMPSGSTAATHVVVDVFGYFQ